MRDPQNIIQLAELPVDMLGFIFYDKSPRFAGAVKPEAVAALPAGIERVGVFVDADRRYVLETAKRFGLAALQLHGKERPELCSELRREGYKVIKAFSVAGEKDFEICAEYETVCDYFLFDTKTDAHGGSGQKFDWQMLSAYRLSVPFFLSGGIGPEDAALFVSVQPLHPQPYAIDINSRFEIEPGLKDIEKIKTFLTAFSKKRE